MPGRLAELALLTVAALLAVIIVVPVGLIVAIGMHVNIEWAYRRRSPRPHTEPQRTPPRWSEPPPAFTRDAEARAEVLLLRVLDDAQLRMFERNKMFLVVAPGRGTFALLFREAYNVLDLATGDRYCAGPPNVPRADLLVAQKLLLEADPERFFSVANRRPACFDDNADLDRVRSLIAGGAS